MLLSQRSMPVSSAVQKALELKRWNLVMRNAQLKITT
jgi:hypothetical protein